MTDLRAIIQSGLGAGYTLDRELGGGGMSRVFVARDETLGRDVVVKVIAPELAEGLSAGRFAREVKLAARLQQANIVPVLTAGTLGALPYFTMPFVRGESLRARLASGTPVSLAEAVGILRDVGRALAYAHTEGVVHRDIKPENILLSGGAAVVTDFGIAKAIDASRTQDGGGITQTGTSIGTPAYMSPEQALGDPHTDQRTDLYAWGVVAWELLGGGHPFAGRTTAQALIAAHLTEAPPSLRQRRPDVSIELEALVMRCLAKDPAERPATAAELLTALETAHTSGARTASTGHSAQRSRRGRMVAAGLLLLAGAVVVSWYGSRHSASPAETVKSIAVIPFTVTGGDTANSYLAEGITDQITNSLALVPGLRLAGRTSAARFGGKSATAQEVGAALNVATVLDGTVRRVGSQIRVSVELSNASDGLVIWKENYERGSDDLFSVQDDIARAIAAALQVTLAGAGTAAVRGTTDPIAYDLYLKGLYLFRRRGPGLATGAASLEQAIARDSEFARAWAGLAATLTVMPFSRRAHERRAAART
ncbi:MAG: serine/threonine-protein kinase [Gemmatimonadales bacterium]|nr:serine/threonine-protein kinase [Gemmatimonadales bacterium]